MATIEADLTSGTVVNITNGRHTWAADEPPDMQGTDTGPTPYELLLGALAACTCITLSYYAQRKGIALTSVSTRFHYEKIHADDCEFCEDDAEGYLDAVRSEVFVEGTFTEAERKRLAEVAVRCPVHKTLEKGIVFDENVTVG
ncbi:MAG: OsmC family protein [Acidimicrobiales bacterium]|nr:OsmC family protein [Acidimicrobiales bacterium]